MLVDVNKFDEYLERLTLDPDSVVLLDSNCILSGEERKRWENRIHEILIIPETIEEIRKRPEQDSANQFVDFCKTKNRILFEHKCPFPYAHRLLLGCSKMLCPAIQARLDHALKLVGEIPKQLREQQVLVEKLVQCVLNESSNVFDSPEYRNEMIDRGFMPNEYSDVPASVKKSFRSYHQKRIKGIFQGNYMFSDETLAAVALTNAVLCDRLSVVVSMDLDLQVVFKQLTDNVLAAASIRDHGIDDKNFEWLTSQIEKWREFREIQKLKNYFLKEQDENQLYPEKGEVVLINPQKKEVFEYSYPKQFKEFLLRFEQAAAEDKWELQYDKK